MKKVCIYFKSFSIPSYENIIIIQSPDDWYILTPGDLIYNFNRWLKGVI